MEVLPSVVTLPPAPVVDDTGLEDLLKELPLPTQEKIESLRKIVMDETEGTIRSRYKLGSVITKMRNNPKKYGDIKDGSKAFSTIARAIGCQKDLLMRACVFSEKVSPEELDEWISKTRSDGSPLTYTHIQNLIQISDTEQRERVRDLTLVNNWSAADLERYMKDNQEERPAPTKRGRPPFKSSNFIGGIEQCFSETKRWINMLDNSWLPAEDGLTTAFLNAGPKELTPAVARRCEDLINLLGKMTEGCNSLEVYLARWKGKIVTPNINSVAITK